MFLAGGTDTHIVYISAARLKEVLVRSMKRKKYAQSCFAYQKGSQIFAFP
jgi:hypothetical protein